MEFKNSFINKYAWYHQNNTCQYIYIYVIFEVFDPRYVFTAAGIRRLRPINQTWFDTTRCRVLTSFL